MASLADRRIQPERNEIDDEMNTDKRLLPAFLLCLFLGSLGLHRFYAGKIGTGVLMLLTLGGLGIWTLIDLIMLVCGAFKDRNGNKITQWT